MDRQIDMKVSIGSFSDLVVSQVEECNLDVLGVAVPVPASPSPAGYKPIS